MNLKYNIKQFYYQSKYYVLFSIFQVVLILTLMVYVLRDFKKHLKKTVILKSELLIGLLMVLDVILYSFINEFRFDLIFVVEWITIIFFFACFCYIILKGLNEIDEDIELILMIFRIILQFTRLGLTLIRIKENTKKRNAAAQDMDLNLTEKSNGVNETINNKEIIIVEL
jgi:hypothetical protein